MSIIDRVRDGATKRLETRAGSILGAVRSAATMQAVSAVGKALGKIDQAQAALVGGAVQAVGGAASPLGRVLGRALGQLPSPAAGSARAASQLARQTLGRIPGSLPPPPAAPVIPARPARAAAPVPPATRWTPAPLWGGMTPDEFYQLFNQSAMTARAWKNLFFVSIEELTPSRESPAGAGAINLLAVDVSFAPVTMPGEAIQIGGANMDSLTATDRVELRLTTFDDDRGTLKRWFIAKCDQAARLDGTFGLPADYLVIVTVAHMDPTNAASSRDRMRHRFLMRPSNIELELSRRGPELEELPMAFVQFDSFMELR